MKIIGFAGSLRKNSYHKMALKVVLDNAKALGAEAEFIDLKELNIPLYDGDLELEIQIPEGVKTLREKIASADGVILAVTGYNHSISGVMKNTLDWLSRTKFAPDILSDKKTAVFSASDGMIGGARAQIAFYPIAITLNLDLMPSKVYLPNVDQKFDQSGQLTDDKTKESLAKFAEKFVAFVAD